MEKPAKTPSTRQLRVAELIRHALSAIFAAREFDEKRLNRALLTITEVRVSPDLKRATAYVMPLGSAPDARLMQLLAGYTPQLRRAIGQRLSLKYTPDLVFAPDEGPARARHIDTLLASDAVRRDLENAP